jgi:hypothetical protein
MEFQFQTNLLNLRASSPLVHNITNFVVMNYTANALLALGASPVMAHAVEEVEDMVAIAGSLVVNIGTLAPLWVEGMKLAMTAAAKSGKPIMLDPVGAGATPYRNHVLTSLMEAVHPTIIRGNGSEILALAGASIQTKGVRRCPRIVPAFRGGGKCERGYGCDREWRPHCACLEWCTADDQSNRHGLLSICHCRSVRGHSIRPIRSSRFGRSNHGCLRRTGF